VRPPDATVSRFDAGELRVGAGSKEWNPLLSSNPSGACRKALRRAHAPASAVGTRNMEIRSTLKPMRLARMVACHVEMYGVFVQQPDTHALRRILLELNWKSHYR
jgi:hypothetical protein